MWLAVSSSELLLPEESESRQKLSHQINQRNSELYLYLKAQIHEKNCQLRLGGGGGFGATDGHWSDRIFIFFDVPLICYSCLKMASIEEKTEFNLGQGSGNSVRY